MSILAVMADLMFSVRIIDEAKKSGLTVQFVKDADAISRGLRNEPALIILDLNYAAVDPVQVIRTIKGNPATKEIPMVAFVSHVQVDLRRDAELAGCDKVVARSAFAQNLPEILALRRSA